MAKKDNETSELKTLEDATAAGRIGTKPSGDDMSEYTLAGQVEKKKKANGKRKKSESDEEA